MTSLNSYGQFCSIARALELLGERWTLLIVRELMSGSHRFNDIQRSMPNWCELCSYAGVKSMVTQEDAA